MNSKSDILFGLPKSVIDSIVFTICKNKNIKKIVLFGSRAKGNFRKGSDIDIAVFSKNLSYSEFMKIKVDLGELMLPYTIDVVDYNALTNIDLLRHIERVGKILFRCSSKIFS